MIKCEFVNRMISIPQCIWNNFTGEDDFCRWIIYDDSRKIEEPLYARKLHPESYGYKKIGFFNYDRWNRLTFEFRTPSLFSFEIRDIIALAEQYCFMDYTDAEKQEIRLKYANHRKNYSLMCYEECPHEEKLAILGRLVHLTPHPKNADGEYIPIICDKNGEHIEWPMDENGNGVSVWDLDDFLEKRKL